MQHVNSDHIPRLLSSSFFCALFLYHNLVIAQKINHLHNIVLKGEKKFKEGVKINVYILLQKRIVNIHEYNMLYVKRLNTENITD